VPSLSTSLSVILGYCIVEDDDDAAEDDDDEADHAFAPTPPTWLFVVVESGGEPTLSLAAAPDR